MNDNQYVDDIGVLKIKMLGGAANAEKVCNLTLKVWSNAIWETSDTKTDKYETLKEMFDMYEEFLEAPVTPSGSYKSYNENVNDLDSDFMKLYNKVDKFDLNHISK